jgi:hypothetical protein
MQHAPVDQTCACGTFAGQGACHAVAAARVSCPAPHPRACARAQTHSPWGAALVKGMMCNWLVCLAVWQATAAQDIIGKIVGIYCARPPPFPLPLRAPLPCRPCRDGAAMRCGSPIWTSLHGASDMRCQSTAVQDTYEVCAFVEGSEEQCLCRLVRTGPHGTCCASVCWLKHGADHACGARMAAVPITAFVAIGAPTALHVTPAVRRTEGCPNLSTYLSVPLHARLNVRHDAPLYLSQVGRSTPRVPHLRVLHNADARAGFDHVIANMFLVPFGMKLGSGVTVGTYIWRSMIPSYIGNTLSGAPRGRTPGRFACRLAAVGMHRRCGAGAAARKGKRNRNAPAWHLTRRRLAVQRRFWWR